MYEYQFTSHLQFQIQLLFTLPPESLIEVASIPVKDEPSPMNDVAVSDPVTVAPELVVANFVLLS